MQNKKFKILIKNILFFKNCETRKIYIFLFNFNDYFNNIKITAVDHSLEEPFIPYQRVDKVYMACLLHFCSIIVSFDHQVYKNVCFTKCNIG